VGNGPGLHHVAFAMKDLPKGIDALKEKGIFCSDAVVAPTGWKVAYFDLEKSGLSLFNSCRHGNQLAETETG
jgi:hypothetical protein